MEPRNGKPRARIEFASVNGEHVVLDLTAVGQPRPVHSGLTDPGGHSASSSLPIMWRGASTLADPETRVIIEGVPYDVPVKVRTGPFIAHEGYYTVRHSMGVFRAGTVISRLLNKPDRVDLGAEWSFASGEQEVSYRVLARERDGQLRIAKLDGSGETVTAQVLDDRLEVSEIRLPAVAGSADGLALQFDGTGGFRVSIEGAEGVVSGRAGVVESPDRSVISLCSEQPSWAVDRVVRVVCTRDGQWFTFASSIGGGR